MEAEKLELKSSRDNSLPFYERKEEAFKGLKTDKQKIRWYYANYEVYKTRISLKRKIKWLKHFKRLPLHIDFIRWILVDFLSGKQRRFWGIYQFVALPGEGKTMSMVAHAERARKAYPDMVIGANFSYVHAEYTIEHWLDIIKISKEARDRGVPCLIMMDEIHVTFDSSDWKSFPAELLALLSFNRKFELQFLCSAQIYERIPKKIRDIANYTVICKNIWGCDRLFRCFYFAKDNYDEAFSGKKAKAEFIRDYIADDDFYALYNTLEQVDRLKLSAEKEKDKRQEALSILFDDLREEAEGEAEAPASASS